MQRGAGVGSGTRTTKAPGVFETIATATSTILVNPLPLLIPLALDLWLWLGVRLSPAALVEPIRGWLEESAAAMPAAAGGGADPALAGWPEGVALADLADLAGAFVPALLAFLDRAALPAPWPGVTFEPVVGGVLALAALIIVLGVGGLMSLLVLLARIGRDEPLDRGVARLIGAATLRYLGFLAVAIVVCLAVAVPTAIALGLLALVLGTAAASLLTLAVLPLAFVASVLLAFTGEAIVVAGAGPLRAPLLSARLVWRNFWPSLGLLIVAGTFVGVLPLIAGSLLTSVPGLLVAALVAAFVATALALAKLQFFADRSGQWAVNSGQYGPRS